MSARAAALAKRIQQADSPPPLAWNTALSDRQISAEVLVAALLLLHDAGQYELAVEGIQAALRNNRGEPWMYDVLALEMTLAKRPQAQIDRVLLSRVDFTSGDTAQMMVTAALMSRFRAYDQAMQICHEAARRNPLQPGVWGMGRRIAMRTQDPDHILWACTGTIRNVWEAGFDELHAESATLLTDLAKRLENAGSREQAEEVRASLAAAQSRDLRVRISWAGNSDLDLIVSEPNDQTCSYKNRMTRNGGALIRQSDGGPESARRGVQSEEYVLSNAPNGEYQIRVRYISGRVISGKVRIDVVRYEGTVAEDQKTLRLEVGETDPVIKVQIDRGRGKATRPRSAKPAQQ